MQHYKISPVRDNAACKCDNNNKVILTATCRGLSGMQQSPQDATLIMVLDATINATEIRPYTFYATRVEMEASVTNEA
jgi:hypothetical protein